MWSVKVWWCRSVSSSALRSRVLNSSIPYVSVILRLSEGTTRETTIPRRKSKLWPRSQFLDLDNSITAFSKCAWNLLQPWACDSCRCQYWVVYGGSLVLKRNSELSSFVQATNDLRQLSSFSNPLHSHMAQRKYAVNLFPCQSHPALP